jgi:SpoIID/LytB domain protein
MRKAVVAAGALVLLIALTGVAVVPTAVPAAAHNEPHIVITGGGWGHGRGMGQYGALGYARDHGWSSRRILDHFYRGTTQGPVPSTLSFDADKMRVDLRYLSSRSTTVALAQGSLLLTDDSGAGLVNITDGAVRLTASGSGFRVETATGCGGPWTDRQVFGRSKIRVVAHQPPGSNPTGSGGLLKVCGPQYSVWYEGEIWAVTNSDGRQRTINVVSVEQYLRGVVPNESPASWPAAALEAQAVAARSYVLAGDTRWRPYADTCDSIWCQVYDGRYTTRGGRWRASTNPRTDDAVVATAGQVRLTSSGTVARTEFSSSTGGFTAGGDFPAVADVGDSVSANPNHRWESHISIAVLESRYRLGDFVGLVVTDRNGHGPWGGRVERLEIRFSNGTRAMSGNDFRRAFGLKSDLFTVSAIHRNADGSPDPGNDGDRDFQAATVDLLYRRLAGRPPTSGELGTWTDALVARGVEAKRELAVRLVHGEPFAGRLIDDLYRRALNRRSDSPGRTYWLNQMNNSALTYQQMGALFYGSDEYFQRAGGSNRSFVTSLYENILGRRHDGGGLDYWTGLMDSGRVGQVDAARLFYESVESRRTRARLLYGQVTAGVLDSASVDDGAEYLMSRSDLDLAVEYAMTLVPRS